MLREKLKEKDLMVIKKVFLLSYRKVGVKLQLLVFSLRFAC